MRSPDLYTVGEFMGLFIAAEGKSVEDANFYEFSVGGAEGNVAVAVHRLGLKVAYQTILSNDPLGESILKRISAEGIDSSLIMRREGFNGTMVRNQGGGSITPEVVYLRKGSVASTISPSDIADDVVVSSRWVHTTSILSAISNSARESVDHVLSLARENHISRSYDLNIRRRLWGADEARKVILDQARDLTILFGGVDEYELIYGSSNPEENLEKAASANVDHVVMTAGPELIRILSKGKRFDFTPAKVPTVDPVGSGDAFVGGTIAGMLSGMSIDEALAQGSKCGASAASHKGDWGGIPRGVNGRIEP